MRRAEPYLSSVARSVLENDSQIVGYYTLGSPARQEREVRREASALRSTFNELVC